jgi:hypothetical protein
VLGGHGPPKYISSYSIVTLIVDVKYILIVFNG